ncbi:MAG: polysaccharide biosynthesis C-terminal domain-containing protein [Bacteroidaceae bacterium]
MSKLTSLAKDTAIYGVSSIVGRFLNYLLVPLYTTQLVASGGGYGIVTNVYSYVALLLVILTYGMETGYFYFANNKDNDSKQVYGTSLVSLASTSISFFLLVLIFLNPIADTLGYSAHPEFIVIMSFVVAMDAFMALPFSNLRFEKRPIRFAAFKIFFIVCSITFNLFFLLGCPWLMEHAPATINWFYDPNYKVGYIFIANLIATSLQLLVFIPHLIHTHWSFSRQLFNRMLRYSFPILILGIVGILNRTIDKMLFPYIYPDRAEAMVQLGIYGACVKVAMIMAMLLQAFRYAYEPFVFGQKKTGDEAAKKTYSDAMKYFLIFSLLAFLCVVCYIDLLRYLISPDYWKGLRVIPIVMVAEMLVGVYFNLSFWYKLIDKTSWGAYFSLAGCIVIIAGNFLLVPTYGYMGSAWSSVAGYTVITLLSYFVGQHYYPINYPLRSIAIYISMTVVIFTCYQFIAINNLLLSVFVKSLLLVPFIWYLLKVDLPIGKILRKLQMKRL